MTPAPGFRPVSFGDHHFNRFIGRSSEGSKRKGHLRIYIRNNTAENMFIPIHSKHLRTPAGIYELRYFLCLYSLKDAEPAACAYRIRDVDRT